MKRSRAVIVMLAAGLLGAAPAAPTSVGVDQVIDKIQADWKRPGAPSYPNAPGWEAYFDRLKAELSAYATAKDEGERLRSLDRLHRMSLALNGVGWAPAGEVGEALRAWLRPRVTLAWAVHRIRESISGLPATSDPNSRANRERWTRFTEDRLGSALKGYESARSVADRQESLRQLHEALAALERGNRAAPWVPSLALESALDDLFNRPNLDATADLASVASYLSNDVVEPGPIWFKGQLSYVTAGPKTGFGLMPSDEGIAFYNSQLMTSVTPIRGFNEQLASDPKGRRAAKLYSFSATSRNDAELTITAVLTTSGLRLAPNYVHNISAAIGSMPVRGAGLMRLIANITGNNQRKITQKVYDGAIGEIRSGVVGGAAELGGIKAGEAMAERNAQYGQYLVGNDTLLYNNLAVTGLSLRSRPEFAMVGGLVQWRGAGEQVGADRPQPPTFETTAPGITADVHLVSVMTNLSRGYLQSDAAREAKNLMVVTRKVPAGTPAREGIVLTENVDYPTYLKAVDETREANDPSVLALRVKRPGRLPEFAVDARGYLVALVHDLVLEVPAPEAAARGGLLGPAARVYRFEIPRAEFVISFQVRPAVDTQPIRLTGRVEDFDAGRGFEVYALDEDEDKPAKLNVLRRAAVIAGLTTQLEGRPIDLPFSNVQLPGFALQSVSPLDPSGWMRVTLTRVP